MIPALEQLALFQTFDLPPPKQDRLSSDAARRRLLENYADKLRINPRLSRELVSFQANKREPFYRWFNYKEGFSSSLVRIGLSMLEPGQTRVLDPFAGIGTSVSTAAACGMYGLGIELMPVGIVVAEARRRALHVDIGLFDRHLSILLDSFPENGDTYRFPHVRITRGAFPEDVENAMAGYMEFLETIDDLDVRFLFWFACFCILEEVSYTRKDGQYLRWDSRSNRDLRSRFSKGSLPSFRDAISAKLNKMAFDIRNAQGRHSTLATSKMIQGSCLLEMPKLPTDSVDLIVTSPPYCNRYDYTRTYALELAFLGYDEKMIADLRQNLLSATVENKSKRTMLATYYEALSRGSDFRAAEECFDGHEALQEVLSALEEGRRLGVLNNQNIPNLVRNYFFEMNLVIREMARVLAPKGRIFMVNDNVRYQGEELPVDLVLSDLAQQAGLEVDVIWVLPRGKGNSSQQMGEFGRTELRKCVYVWRKS